MSRRLQRFWVLAVFVAGALMGCARAGLDAVRANVAEGQGHLITTVPFIPQDAYQCGPAALAMVLRYYGVEGVAADQDRIARILHLPSARGALNLDLEFYARRQGFRTRAFPGSVDLAKAELRRQRPLIVFQDLGRPFSPAPHFAVLLGYDERAGVVVLHSGRTPYRVVPVAEFEHAWAARRYWTLLILPADQEGRKVLPRAS